jgi:uncharacterized sporulation protein YeaH/YhbH (DUF444 family)
MYLLQIAIKDTIPQIKLLEKSNANSSNIWLFLAVGEFLIIILLFLYINHLKRKNTHTKFEKEILEAKDGDINMTDLMLSINKSRELYKELSRKCHPDKHIESEFQKEIEELFQEITENQRNYVKLVELKEKAISIYKINFD